MRIIISLLFLFLVLFTSPAVAADIKADFTKAYNAYNAAVEAGDKDAVIEAAQRAYQVGKKRFGEDDINTGGLALNYGNALLGKWRGEEAVEVLTFALEIYEQVYGKKSLDLIDPLLALAEAERSNYKKKWGIVHLHRASDIVEQQLGKDVGVYYEIELMIGQIYYYGITGRKQSTALAYFERAHEWYRAKYGEESPHTAQAVFWIGKSHLQGRKYKLAITDFNEALKGLDSSTNSQHRLALSTHAFLVSAYEKLGDKEKSREHCRTIGMLHPKDEIDGAQPVYRAPLVFPKAMASTGKEGEVVVEFTVDKNGETKNIKVVEGESRGGKGFYKATVEAIAKTRYAPRYQNGEFLETKNVRNRLVFKLTD